MKLKNKKQKSDEVTQHSDLLVILSTEPNLVSAIVSSILAFGLAGLTGFGILHLILDAKTKHYKIIVKANKQIIDVISIYDEVNEEKTSYLYDLYSNLREKIIGKAILKFVIHLKC